MIITNGHIKTKIKVDPNLRQEKIEQMWSLFNKFPDIFAWHKGEFGCCKYGKYIVDIQGFPPCRTIPNKLSFSEEVEINKTNRCAGSLGQDEAKRIELCL